MNTSKTLFALAMGLVLGGGAAGAYKVMADSNTPATVPNSQGQSVQQQTSAQATETPSSNVADQTDSSVSGGNENASGPDTDNIQDESGTDQNETASENDNGKESSDQTEKDENLPGGGHQDSTGADHQFEGVE